MSTLYVGGERSILRAEILWEKDRPLELQILDEIEVGAMPSYLHFLPGSPLVLAVSEDEGMLISLLRDADGRLNVVSRVPCEGGPCYVSADPRGRFAFTASYGSGETRVYPLSESGVLSTACACLHTGKYTHCVQMVPRARADSEDHAAGRGAFTLVALSKGTDSLALLRFEPETNSLTHIETIPAPSGSGPRHIVFNKEGTRAYVSCENDCGLLIYAVESLPAQETLGTGPTLRVLGQTSLLPHKQQEGDTGSDVHLSEDGAYVYASVRGHNSIAVLRVADNATSLLANVATPGLTPRCFCLESDTRLVVANQDSSSLSFFHRDVRKGSLHLAGTLSVGQRPFWVGHALSR